MVRASREKSIRKWIVEVGSPLMHIGILLIVVGMFMGQFTGFSDTAALASGEVYEVESGDFEVRLDSFEIVYDEGYNITDYISTVTVIEDGKEVLTTEIAVNKPLVYEGVKFYQSTYGWAAKVKISEAETSEVLLDSVLKMQMSSGGIGDVMYSAYDDESGKTVTQRFLVIPDQASEGTVNTLSPLPNNPALFFILYYDSDIYIIEDIGLGSSEDVGGLIVSFEGLEYYTGLEVSSKPELPVVFTGSLIFIAGLIIVFYVRKGVKEGQEVEDIGG
jgi:cytochrome c biogenesis protein